MLFSFANNLQTFDIKKEAGVLYSYDCEVILRIAVFGLIEQEWLDQLEAQHIPGSDATSIYKPGKSVEPSLEKIEAFLKNKIPISKEEILDYMNYR